ncbi:MAG: N-acetyl-alpha-D-glucosaminyl L-malate synthase [Alphaproteobacteria bacterium MarineAlpha3_Bin7]|nr:MAG: N-acetyl-alpha-D-glucosaminyl L-malate synthase [Alphaproteobacteria bacterium MarineAlpha3_Bin7]|tara:strand:- start:2267 stop:3394 length:1128 start_codon:yes stop_codon:yes gene_type:complete
MNIAFYAPLKSPNSRIPSGDREMARSLIYLLEYLGHDVRLVSEFQSREPEGREKVQRKLEAQGSSIADKLAESYLNSTVSWKPDIWFTYHVYYKAPDWIGLKVTKKINIPYVIAEVSHAPKRANGPWKNSHIQVENSIKHADLILGLNSRDYPLVSSILQSTDHYIGIKPFTYKEFQEPGKSGSLNRSLIDSCRGNTDRLIFLSVAMMRYGAKYESYRTLAEALREVAHLDWKLLVAGGGPARIEVEKLFEGLPVKFLGEVDKGKLSYLMSNSDIFLWPAIDEAYGMSLLEAQFNGLPVIAGSNGGVGDIVRENKTGVLTPVGDVKAFVDAINLLSADKARLAKMSSAAIKIMNEEHSIDYAAKLVGPALRGLIK